MAGDEPLLLGIDLGTSAVKVLALSPSGCLHGVAEESSPPESPRPGWLEVSPQRWWEATKTAIARLFASSPEPGTRVGAVGLSAAFPALILLDKSFQPLRPAILYADQRSTAQAQALAGRIGTERFRQLTGNRLAPGTCTLTSLRWVMEQEPDVFSHAKVFGYANSYLAMKLTGQLALDEASAPLTGLYHLRRGTWSDDLLTEAEVPESILPPLLPPTSAVGSLTADAAHALGLAAGIPVAIGSGDTVTSTLGAGAMPEEPFLTSGFTDSLVSLSSEPTPIDGFVTTGGALPGQWLRIGARSATGAAVDWAARELLNVEVEQFFALAGQAPAGAEGVLFLSHLAGERTPLWDPKARGMFVGLTLATSAGDVARSVVEGVSFGVREMLELLMRATATKPSRVRAAGGGTRDAFWRQLRADVCGVEFLYLSTGETAALGAALLGGVAAGLIEDPLHLARTVQEQAGAALVKPDPGQADFYRALAPRHARLYPTLRPLTHQLPHPQRHPEA